MVSVEAAEIFPGALHALCRLAWLWECYLDSAKPIRHARVSRLEPLHPNRSTHRRSPTNLLSDRRREYKSPSWHATQPLRFLPSHSVPEAAASPPRRLPSPAEPALRHGDVRALLCVASGTVPPARKQPDRRWQTGHRTRRGGVTRSRCRVRPSPRPPGSLARHCCSLFPQGCSHRGAATVATRSRLPGAPACRQLELFQGSGGRLKVESCGHPARFLRPLFLLGGGGDGVSRSA